MREQMLKSQDIDDGVYEFVCVSCGVAEVSRLTVDGEVPHCGCGAPLSPMALVSDTSIDQDVCGEKFLDEFRDGPKSFDHWNHEAPEFGCLDHPHVEPDCQFCAARQQRPSQHRLWCSVFLFRVCSCGYEQA